ncbi:hypothetical protein D3C73_1630710 [compost metagenome]
MVLSLLPLEVPAAICSPSLTSVVKLLAALRVGCTRKLSPSSAVPLTVRSMPAKLRVALLLS